MTQASSRQSASGKPVIAGRSHALRVQARRLLFHLASVAYLMPGQAATQWDRSKATVNNGRRELQRRG